jgi:hypothetical protein
MEPSSQCSVLGLDSLLLVDNPASEGPLGPNALCRDIAFQLRAAGLIVDPIALRSGIEHHWPAALPAIPDVAACLPDFSALTRPVRGSSLCPAPWSCPFGCPGAEWSTQLSCTTHVERSHLQQGADSTVIAIWLDAIKRTVCRDCRLLVLWGRKCKKCGQRAARPWGGDQGPPPTSPGLAEDPVPDELWRQLVAQSLPVLRVIPLGCQDAFFSQLS